MKTKNQILSITVLLIFCFLLQSVSAQVGINTTSPDDGSILDIESTTKGIFIPKVNIVTLSTIAPIIGIGATAPELAAAESLLVYNTNVTTGEGFYYWSGTEWLGIGQKQFWGLEGNSGTIVSTNFLGTTDNVDIMFKRNNIASGRIGVSNTSFGEEALILNNTGTDNSAFGKNALVTNVSGDSNSAFGVNALQLNTATDNSAFGKDALKSNSTGIDNAAFGRSALEKNTIGLGNSAFGEHALFENLDGSSNTAVGENALEENTSGIGNTVIGEDAGTRNTTGSGNVVIGQEALFSNPLGVSTGDNNVIIGRYAAQSNTSGRLNVIIGKDAMLSSTSSNFNVIMGVGAGSDPDSRADAAAITTGDQNTLIGYKTQVSSSAAENATALGFRALADCDDCLVLGGVSGVNSGTSVNVGIGVNDPQYRLDVDGDINVSSSGTIRRNGSDLHPDYVFETYLDNNNSYNKAYKFMTLKEVETFLKDNYHLPGVQSRKDVLENGWIISENVRVNLEKIEELYLHQINLNNKIEAISQEKEALQNLVNDQKTQLEVQAKKIDLILQKLNNN